MTDTTATSRIRNPQSDNPMAPTHRHRSHYRYRRRNARGVSRLRHERDRRARPARRARWPEAGASPHPLCHARHGPALTTSRTAKAPASSARCWANTIRTATRPSTMPWCAWPRISPCATRWSMARATLARSMATAPRPCATPRPGWPRSPRRCWPTSTKTRSISAPTSTTR